MRGAVASLARRAQLISPGIQIQSLVDCFGLGAHVFAAVVFLVVR